MYPWWRYCAAAACLHSPRVSRREGGPSDPPYQHAVRSGERAVHQAEMTWHAAVVGRRTGSCDVEERYFVVEL